jgi:uncharacterized protein (TIGR03086 family)
MDLLDLDRRALAATGRLVDAIPPDALGRPTPCAAWDVRAVINHVVGNNVLYAAAAAGSAVDWAERQRDHVGADPQVAYARSSSAVTDAFATADLGKELEMPFGRFSAGQALAVHFVDVLVHGWDLAVATDQDSALDPELASAAIGIVGFYPPDVFGTEQFFAAGLPVAADAPPGERLVAMLGRQGVVRS